MKPVFLQLQRFARCVVLCLLVVAPVQALALGNGAGPNGINIGIDFNWGNGPLGYSASFIFTTSPSGGTLENCTNGGGPVTPTSSNCDFPIAFSIGGTPQTAVISGGSYETWQNQSSGLDCDSSNGVDRNSTAPLTFWNCFNANSFGQIFEAKATGALSNMTMPLTCLNPSGGTLTGLIAVIYQINPDGTIPAAPLAQVPVDLSTCPTLTTWTGHAFSSGDFAEIPLNFSGVTLTNGNFYGVYFAGPLVPGAQLPGITPPVAAPTLTEWGEIALAAALLALGLWKLRRRSVA
jgi:hypothetical protein